ncbi:hypothetical protein XccvBFoX7_gp45c [Xanthomonas phage FoX7]|nr:hypothetical protein HOV04_gp41 [Xanthomonas phage XcP1]AWN08543.1 hypothetical protein XcP1_041 [Xanthomonas phage XcP1]QJB22103.1 hypothetical protein XccvBFoX6_gp45c [Xanthomonas phage FoX6]QJB22202.1 hypothetical protein XccvBFoX7_gp45c [Xanthomonas phage FoX7]
MQPRVYIPQIVKKMDPTRGVMVEAHDYKPAMLHGQLTPILDDGDSALYLSRHVHKIKKILSDFTHEDYLIAVGDPCLIAVCAGIIMRRQPTFTMLKWERTMRQYIKMEISV